MFWSLARRLSRKEAEIDMIAANRHSSMSFAELEGPTVEFVWDPYLNSTNLPPELKRTSSRDLPAENGSHASIVMFGGGLWFAKDPNELFLQRFNESIEGLLHKMRDDKPKEPTLDALPEFLPQMDHTASLVLFAPVPKPLYACLDTAHAKVLTPNRIQPLREKLLQTWQRRKFPVLWAFDLMTANDPRAFQADGIHVVDNIADSMVELMLNVKCNNFLMQARHYPRDTTCCSTYPQPKFIQMIFVTVAWSSLLIFCLLKLVRSSLGFVVYGKSGASGRTIKPSSTIGIMETWLSQCFPPRQILRAIAVFLLACYYCWWVDRTPLLNKLQKQYFHPNFRVLCLATAIAGLCSMQQTSVSARQTIKSIKGPQNIPFLGRDQTDEWKGWMQFLILIYHYTGASKVLWIYKLVRLLVASYVFLTGYGHTIYFYERADFSLKRVATVLIRLNMLSCTLPFMMNTDYIFYYFAPLTSFWYLVVYTTMAAGRSHNKHPMFLIAKVIVSAVVTTAVIFHYPRLFKSAFFLLEKFCNIHWDSKDWCFRLSLDNYIVYFGMLVGIFTAASKERETLSYARSKDDKMLHTSNLSNRLVGQINTWTFDFWLRYQRSLYLTIVIIGCFLYGRYAYLAKDKEQHNAWFPMVSFGPILAFVAMRDCLAWTRRYHSAVFAWMGRISLETFILQYHIWLAADTKGIVSTGFFQRHKAPWKWAEFALLTALFLWGSWHVASATQTLTAYIIDPKSTPDLDNMRQDLPLTRKVVTPKGSNPGVAVNGFSRLVRRLVPGIVNTSLGQCVSGLKNSFAEHLWMRLFAIFLVLWVLNMVSSRLQWLNARCMTLRRNIVISMKEVQCTTARRTRCCASRASPALKTRHKGAKCYNLKPPLSGGLSRSSKASSPWKCLSKRISVAVHQILGKDFRVLKAPVHRVSDFFTQEKGSKERKTNHPLSFPSFKCPQ